MSRKVDPIDQAKKVVEQLRCALTHPLLPEGKHRFNSEAKLVPDVAEIYFPLFKLYEKPDAAAFHEPVNAVELGIFTYYDIITDPMSIRDVLDRIEQGEYSNGEQVMQDLEKIWRNCEIYNGVNSEYGQKARQIEKELRAQIERKRDDMKASPAEQESILNRVHVLSEREEWVIDEVIQFVGKHSPTSIIDGEVEFSELSVGLIRMLKDFLANIEAKPVASRKRGRETPA